MSHVEPGQPTSGVDLITRPDVRIDGLTRTFGDIVAVDDLELAVQAGSFFTVVGPSGCGKTTLLRLISGLERPDAGQVLINGDDVTALPAHRRPTATVFQDFALFPHLSVADNIGFGLRQRRIASASRDRRVAEMLDLVGLPGSGERRPDQLSGGQQQRVALARALAVRPRVLLLDEPLGSLDPGLRQQLQGDLRRIQQALGTTFIATTHDLAEALTLSDQVAVMRHGRIEQVSTPGVLFEYPQTRFVARFLGYRLLLDGVVETASNRDGLATVRTGAHCWQVAATGTAAGKHVGLTIRPERISLVPAGGGGLPGVMMARSFSGQMSGVVVDVAGMGPVDVAMLSANDPAFPAPGEEVGVVMPAKHLRLVRE